MAVLNTALGVQGQANSGPSTQAAVPGAQTELPAKWSEGVKALAGKIAAAVKPSQTISLEVKNISSLGAPEVEAIRKALASDLESRGIRMAMGGSGVVVNLSENSEGYVWAAESRRIGKDENAPRVAIVFVGKLAPRSADNTSEALVLSKRLVWEQRTEFLDFLIAERPTTVMSSTLVILEVDNLVYYRSRTFQWEHWRTIAFPRLERSSRAFRGRIDTGWQKAWGPGGECSGDLSNPDTMICSSHITILANVHFGVRIPDRENDQVELLSERCGEQAVAVTSGNGDWTQPDSLQAFLVPDVLQSTGTPSGSPLDFDGPVKSMQVDDRESLRVVVHNLKSGNYEGYIVTATCSH